MSFPHTNYCTVSRIDPSTEETQSFAVMGVVPALTAVARPVELIVAIPRFEDCHVIQGDVVRSCVIEGVAKDAIAVNCCVEPAGMMVEVAELTRMDVGSATVSVVEAVRPLSGSVAVMVTVPLTPVAVDEVTRPEALISTIPVGLDVQLTTDVQFRVSLSER